MVSPNSFGLFMGSKVSGYGKLIDIIASAGAHGADPVRGHLARHYDETNSKCHVDIHRAATLARLYVAGKTQLTSLCI